MMKKSIVLLLALAIALVAVPSVFAEMTVSNVTFRFPTNNMYNASSDGLIITLNASVNWTQPTNLTNLSFIFTKSGNSTYFLNNTINGSRTSATKGDFTVKVDAGNLSAGAYSVVIEIHNQSDNIGSAANRLNTTAITFVIDRTSPSVSISSPYTGSTVLPSGGGMITFDWTPSDANFGNCSLHLNNQLVKSRTSGTTGANVSSGSVNRFSQQFGGDNSSIRLAVNCIDLAGLRTASSSYNNFTFTVLTSGFSPAQKQAIAAAAGGSGGGIAVQSPQSSGFTATPQNAVIQAKTSFQKWAWAWIIGGVIVLVFAVKKLKK